MKFTFQLFILICLWLRVLTKHREIGSESPGTDDKRQQRKEAEAGTEHQLCRQPGGHSSSL